MLLLNFHLICLFLSPTATLVDEKKKITGARHFG